MRLGKTIEKLTSKEFEYEKVENDCDSCCVSAGAYRSASEHPVG